MYRLQKTSFAKFVIQSCVTKRSLIFTGQNTVAVKNAVTCFRMMRSIAPCAGRNKIMKESQYKDVKIPEDVALEAGDKIFLWENLKTLRPLCDAFTINK